MSYWYKFKKWLFTLVGDIAVLGWKSPLWLIYKPSAYKFRGDEYYHCICLITQGRIQKGDILLRRYDHFLDRRFIPGDLNHGGIYVGKDESGVPSVIHSMSGGVFKESIFDFMRTDHLVILRPRNVNQEDQQRAVDLAYDYVGSPYDFDFSYGDTIRIYCTELIGRCWSGASKKFKFRFSHTGLWPILKRRKALVADDVFCSDLDIVFMTASVKEFSVWMKRFKVVTNPDYKSRNLHLYMKDE